MTAASDEMINKTEEPSRKRERREDNNDESEEEAEFDDDGSGSTTGAGAGAGGNNDGGDGDGDDEVMAADADAAVPTRSSSADDAVVFSPELLGMYYSRLFPFHFLHSWLSYDPSSAAGTKGTSGSSGNNNALFPRREFSFTIEPTPGDEIYIRYQSFASESDFAAAVLKRRPTKIDIGAVFTHPPKDKNAFQSSGKFQTEQRELVFDVDLTDYDAVRNCGCSGAKICPKCWTMMTMAVKVMDRGLKDDFGFQHVAWFYSGRRGVHAWVCDESARTLSNEARSAVAAYFEVSMGSDKNKNTRLPYPLHPLLTRSFDILEPLFIQHILPESGHGLLASESKWTEVLKSLPPAASPVSDKLQKKWSKDGHDTSPEEKWREFKRHIAIFVGKKDGAKAPKNLSSTDRTKIETYPTELVFQYTYPRLDINVSKMQNHLLKSPFCVHPKTGRVCVPFEAAEAESFDPFDVPTLPRLMKELDEYEKQRKEDRDGEEVDKDKVTHEWQKTSLREPFERFQKSFLMPMWNDLRKVRREEAEERAARTGDF